MSTDFLILSLAYLVLFGGLVYFIVCSVKGAFKRNKVFGWCIIMLLAVTPSIMAWECWQKYQQTLETRDSTLCCYNLKIISTIIESISEKGNVTQFLNEKWCDQLLAKSRSVELLEFSKETLQCPSLLESDCSYALNTNVIGKQLNNIDDKVVVLFESDVGWNAVGGQESLVFRHRSGQKCNVLLADGTIVRISESEANELKWKP